MTILAKYIVLNFIVLLLYFGCFATLCQGCPWEGEGGVKSKRSLQKSCDL